MKEGEQIGFRGNVKINAGTWERKKHVISFMQSIGCLTAVSYSEDNKPEAILWEFENNFYVTSLLLDPRNMKCYALFHQTFRITGDQVNKYIKRRENILNGLVRQKSEGEAILLDKIYDRYKTRNLLKKESGF